MNNIIKVRDLLGGGVMSVYNDQYKQYYEGLKGRSVSQGIRVNGVQEYSPIYSGYSSVGNNRKYKRNHLAEWIDIFISQVVITIILAATILYMKYSTDLQVVDAFKTFKSSINNGISYSQLYEEVKSIDMNSILDKAKGSIQWIKEKVDENPLNY